ncbi:MAG: hypothetical protein LBF09_04910, partial [Odoribacteraceae bacterium]|nr:hypothetical protein [Odoribacteraceae bacterium]
ALSDKPVTRVEELVNQALDTKTPFEISFPDEDRGKFFYYSLCWKNTREESGPFGPILMSVVP